MKLKKNYKNFKQIIKKYLINKIKFKQIISFFKKLFFILARKSVIFWKKKKKMQFYIKIKPFPYKIQLYSKKKT
jgi:hypothetical protein